MGSKTGFGGMGASAQGYYGCGLGHRLIGLWSREEVYWDVV